MNVIFKGLVISGHGEPKVLAGEVLLMSEPTAVNMAGPSKRRDYHEITLKFGVDQFLPIDVVKTVVLLLEFDDGLLKADRPLQPLEHAPAVPS